MIPVTLAGMVVLVPIMTFVKQQQWGHTTKILSERVRARPQVDLWGTR